MATSGTASWSPDLTEIMEEAYERVGREMRTGYDFRTARRSLNALMSEWASRGVNMWTMEQGTQVLTPGTATYNLPADTVDLIEQVTRTGTGQSQADISLTRISVSTYSTIPNKTATGRPLQIWIERLNTPRFTLWPVPDDTATYTVVYWRLRRIQDAGDGYNTVDMPFRFVPALIAGLAYHLALKVPGGLERIQLLKAQYDEAWDLAASEDRERAAVRWVPRNFTV
jgi:hypothetical protein